MKKMRCVQMLTPEGETLMNTKKAQVWDVYPRPTMQRNSFLCLNGEWEFCTVKSGDAPTFDESICVPFVPQSVLSGIGRAISQKEQLCYRKSFDLPDAFLNGRVILHFDAVDQVAEVFVNGERLAWHEGGYDRFSIEITAAMKKTNTVEVWVFDTLDDHVLPYGKQRQKRGGMWYTPVSGIWQSVWLECVPETYITAIHTQVDSHGADITVLTSDGKATAGQILLHLPTGDRVLPLCEGHARVDVEDPILWSPENPHLYRMTVEVGEDRVESYFALRTLEIKEFNGVSRLCLNGNPYFFHGLLDQGYFCDGIFTPATPEGYERDILAAKRMGFNMLRKHIKVEPEIFYYDCDRLGMVVFQDMVNNGDYSFFRDTALPTVGMKRRNDRRMHRDPATRAAFLESMKKTVEQLKKHPCVCYWTIFNEGWGQFDHAAAYKMLKELDGTRFVDSVSGWFLPPKGEELASDVESIHVYFKPVKAESWKRPLVLSEFGGYAHRAEGHVFNLDHNYGYRNFESVTLLEEAITALYENEIIPLAARGLCADVYTQLTDVEDETNGLLTYDRRMEKVSADRMKKIADQLRRASDAQCELRK